MRKRSQKFDIGKNVESTFSKTNMMTYLEVLGVAVYSVGLATMTNLKGWVAYAVSYGVPALAGAILNRPAMFITALAGASLHASFYFGDKMLSKSEGTVKSTWGIENTQMNGLSNDTQNDNGLPPGVQLVNFNNRMIAVEPKQGLSDWVTTNEPAGFLNDYISEEEFSFGNSADYLNQSI